MNTKIITAKLQKLKEEVKLPSDFEKFDEVVLRQKFSEYKDRIENFEVRDDDIWVVTFPKSGTTWAQEMVWLLANNLDYEGAKQIMDRRYAFLEIGALISPKLKPPNFIDPIDRLNNTPRRRFIKTHLVWQLLPRQIRDGSKRPKIIYVTRNIKDVLVSFYHHVKLIEADTLSLDEFFKLFITDNYMYSPYWRNVLTFWSKLGSPNLFLLKYEDMIKDLQSIIHEISSFLETSVPDEEMGRLLRHLSFEEMKKNNAVNYEHIVQILHPNDTEKRTSFMRKGTMGSYKDELTEEMVELLEVWTEMNVAGTGFPI